jgi:prepilin-type N-terminal cleavage/methylation domain-containing protein
MFQNKTPPGAFGRAPSVFRAIQPAAMAPPLNRHPAAAGTRGEVRMSTTGRNRGGRGEQGWTLIELLVVVAVSGLMLALAITPTVGAMRALRIGTDRRALVTTIALARMRAAAGFTRARVYANLNNRRFRLDRKSVV